MVLKRDSSAFVSFFKNALFFYELQAFKALAVLATVMVDITQFFVSN